MNSLSLPKPWIVPSPPIALLTWPLALCQAGLLTLIRAGALLGMKPRPNEEGNMQYWVKASMRIGKRSMKRITPVTGLGFHGRLEGSNLKVCIPIMDRQLSHTAQMIFALLADKPMLFKQASSTTSIL